MVNSINKGKAGEREFANYLKDHNIQARRGQQHRGTPDSPDVISELPFHIEVKRTERLNHIKALKKAKSESDKPPLVAHRKNREDWIIILYADDFINLLRDDKE